MAKSITAGAQKLMESFLGSVEGKCAFYDDDKKLLWTNCSEFFEKFDLKKVDEEDPIKSEVCISVNIDGEKSALCITPVYRTLRTIVAYICIARNDYEVYSMMDMTSIPDYTNNAMEKTEDKLEKLTELNSYIEEAIQDEDGAERAIDLIREQKRLLVSMKNETKYQRQTCFIEKSDDDLNCNLTMMFSAMCNDAEESFRDLGRKIIFKGEGKDYYIAEDSKALQTSFMHLLRSHMILSPLKSILEIATYYEASSSTTSNFCVSIKTRLKPSSQIEDSALLSSYAYRELSKKVVKYDYQGIFNVEDDGKTLKTEFKIPVLKKNRGPMLTASNSWYLDGRSRPLHTYMKDIIEQEITDIEQEKMETSKKRKLAKHE